MKLAGEIFDRGSDARRGTIDGVADDRITAMLDGVEDAPAGKIGELVGGARGILGMRLGEDQEFRLEVDDFFEIDLRPVLGRVDDGDGAGMLQSIGDEGVFADGDEGLGPDDEQNAAGRQRGDAIFRCGDAALHFFAEGRSGFRSAEQIGEALGGSDDGFHGVRIGGVGRDAQGVEGVDGFQAIEIFGDEDEVGMQRGNGFETRIDGAADLGLLLSFGRVIAIIGVSDETILQAEGVNRFGEIGGEGNDSADGLGDADGAAEFVGDFAVCGGDGILCCARC